jgi:hypothetical protein
MMGTKVNAWEAAKQGIRHSYRKVRQVRKVPKGEGGSLGGAAGEEDAGQCHHIFTIAASKIGCEITESVTTEIGDQKLSSLLKKAHLDEQVRHLHQRDRQSVREGIVHGRAALSVEDLRLDVLVMITLGAGGIGPGNPGDVSTGTTSRTCCLGG